MSDLLMGLAGAGIGAIILTAIPAFLKREKVFTQVYNFMTKLRKLGLAYDIPIIGGSAETSIKDTIFSTISDILHAGSLAIDGEPNPFENVKEELKKNA